MTHPVVLLHGMWCTGANWNRVREVLEPRGYRCHAPTLPGHDPLPDQPLQVARRSLTDYLGFLETFCAEQAFARRPILIGHSMGALLAQQLAARLQPLALVLLTPAPHWGINGLRVSNVAALAPWLLGGLFWRKPFKPTFEQASRYFFNQTPTDRRRLLYEGLVHESGRALSEVAFWWANFARAAAVRSDDVRCPVYVVSCGEDRLTPAAVVRKVSARYPQCAQRHYPDRGHWVIDDEETEEMMHGICGWLRPIEQRDGVAHAR
jgi:pimeloyl-ACP methyl ester carboxylesterase